MLTLLKKNSNKCLSFELSIHKRILKRNILLIIKGTVSLIPNQQIRIIPEGSCDTED